MTKTPGIIITHILACALLAILACAGAGMLVGCADGQPQGGSSSGSESSSAASPAQPDSEATDQETADSPSNEQSSAASDASTPEPDVDVESAATTTLLGPSPSWVAKLPEAADAQQMVVVAGYEGTTAWVSMHERDESGNWQMVVTTPGFIGKLGIGKTVEGDALTPRGSFTFDRAFGIAPDPGCKMTYTQVTEDLYWSGDHREGMRYNQMVDIKDLPGLDTTRSEHLIDYTREYQYCLNISFNPDCVPGDGSAIFLHCMGAKRPYTAGCVAIPEAQMRVVMQHVEPGCAVVIDTLGNLGASL